MPSQMMGAFQGVHVCTSLLDLKQTTTVYCLQAIGRISLCKWMNPVVFVLFFEDLVLNMCLCHVGFFCIWDLNDKNINRWTLKHECVGGENTMSKQ